MRKKLEYDAYLIIAYYGKKFVAKKRKEREIEELKI